MGAGEGVLVRRQKYIYELCDSSKSKTLKRIVNSTHYRLWGPCMAGVLLSQSDRSLVSRRLKFDGEIVTTSSRSTFQSARRSSFS